MNKINIYVVGSPLVVVVMRFILRSVNWGQPAPKCMLRFYATRIQMSLFFTRLVWVCVHVCVGVHVWACVNEQVICMYMHARFFVFSHLYFSLHLISFNRRVWFYLLLWCYDFYFLKSCKLYKIINILVFTWFNLERIYLLPYFILLLYFLIS